MSHVVVYTTVTVTRIIIQTFIDNGKSGSTAFNWYTSACRLSIPTIYIRFSDEACRVLNHASTGET